MLTGLKVTKRFGGLVAVREMDFEVKEGEIVGLIGPNGSGKTTLFNVISGIYHADKGRIKFNGTDITKMSVHKRCRLGIGRTFQIVRPFNEISLIDNVKLGFMFGKKKHMSPKEMEERAIELLDFVDLKKKSRRKAEELILIEKKKLEIARALATEPKIILLDEPLGGLNPAETLEAMKLIRDIRDGLGITVFWIEHVMRAVMNVAERIMVLNQGEKIAEGTPKEISKNRLVIEAYLGKRYAKRGI